MLSADCGTLQLVLGVFLTGLYLVSWYTQ